ncbi:acetate/propionate family kinase [Ligilactobacillus animalis]|uniref:Acetate kinase n=1 Tax=Ligilactobacillus animalis TaxID=1605 RepID=A0AAJ6FS47_9LACO|nr:acetate kinase [Ligilactobacillus animalis]KRM59881.1 acetate kinase [Ligilactobacillus animalis KCTC 3501 = DSM 20602]MBU5279940.1 acetate kinase [Ligilactobacillus animalis]MDO5883904.1 acetate kinase [Ligilactobacillus animalis]MDU1486624.1 acetate kinase [Ligilactobacillus animalis]MDU8986820.1 acetate kinase [Ligilactobacillus animalis]
MEKIMIINSGSSSLKFKLFNNETHETLASGIIERIGIHGSKIKVKYGDGQKYELDHEITNHLQGIELLLNVLKELNLIADLSEIKGIGHRVVAGGEYFSQPVVVDNDVIAKIKELAELAPLHNPANLNGIKAFRKYLPNALSVAVFDTAFHQTLPQENYMYSTPYEWYEKYGVRRYGAHGISHEYVARKAAELMGRPFEDLKLITCHLGAGASITAVKHGRSFDTSMGFTPLSGIQMATRAGDVDISLANYIMKKLNVQSMSDMVYLLNEKSGFLGVSGVSADMRDVEDAAAAGNKRAELAIKLFYNSILRYVGQYITEMGGVDGIVFTGGIGENSPETSEEIMKRLAYMGVTINEAENKKRGAETIISGPDSTVTVMRIPTDEEYMIAQHVWELLGE